MRIVVTGATSFVGAATVNELLNRGHEVIAVVRPGSKKLDRIPSQEGLSIVENDLSDSHLLPEKIKENCDVFCHFGWGGSGSDASGNCGICQGAWDPVPGVHGGEDGLRDRRLPELCVQIERDRCAFPGEE